MTKAKIKMLERIFALEIEGRLPFQSKSKVLLELEQAGMVERYRREYPPDRFGKIVVDGWALSQIGRFEYCTWASEQPMPSDLEAD